MNTKVSLDCVSIVTKARAEGSETKEIPGKIDGWWSQADAPCQIEHQ